MVAHTVNPSTVEANANCEFKTSLDDIATLESEAKSKLHRETLSKNKTNKTHKKVLLIIRGRYS